jgi:dihydroorotate dehydrogenase (fumarate)
MIDLSTTYLGLSLRTPIVASASPLCRDLTKLRQMEEAGASAVVLHSLFEEQITLENDLLDRYLTETAHASPEALSYFPDLPNLEIGPKAYLDHISRAKKLLKIPVIGSLNGVSDGGWTHYAREIELAGADGLELNIYMLPTSVDDGSEGIEVRYCDLIAKVKSQVNIPVAVKLSPYFTSMANMAWRLDQTGIQALVLFNRFYQPDIDIEALQMQRSLFLSTSEELRLRLHWVALLSKRIRADLAITGGVHTAEDVLKGIMAGAQVTMMTSALLKRGISHLKEVEHNLVDWMEEHEYETIGQMRGSMNALSIPDASALARTNYVDLLSRYVPEVFVR